MEPEVKDLKFVYQILGLIVGQNNKGMGSSFHHSFEGRGSP